VVRPLSTQEVSQVVKICAVHKIAIVPQGGNTSYMGGAVPHTENEIILSLGRMDKVREINARDFTMTVDAGCILQNLQEAAAPKNCLLPLKLASEGTCQIGGNIATNAGGILDHPLRQYARSWFWVWKSYWPTAKSGTDCAICARIIRAMI
jgi:FAD/FMN-containing dehydrogenase